MCGRYLFALEIDEVVKSYTVDKVLGVDIRSGEVFPGTEIPVILEKHNSRFLTSLFWGIQFKGKSIINVRFETADEKPMFKNLINYSRCIIPASSFYEWKSMGKSKKKMEIYPKDKKILSLGGIYGTFKDNNGKDYISVVILTVPASESICQIHHRMPIIIPEDSKNEWLSQKTLKDEKNYFIKRSYEEALAYKNSDSIEQISFL